MIYLKLFLTFFKIGAFTFGGGYAMLPLMADEVAANNWMTTEELVNFIAVSESTPGVLAINAATYVGAELGGLAGAACATLGVVLPSLIIILIIARFLMKFSKNVYVQSVMRHLKPAVVGLIGSAIITLGTPVFMPRGWGAPINPLSLALSVVIFGSMLFMAIKKKHPILIIGISAAAGIAAGYAAQLAGLDILA